MPRLIGFAKRQPCRVLINPFGQKAEAKPLPAQEIKNISEEADFDGPLG